MSRYDDWRLASPPEYDDADEWCPDCGGTGRIELGLMAYSCRCEEDEPEGEEENEETLA